MISIVVCISSILGSDLSTPDTVSRGISFVLTDNYFEETTNTQNNIICEISIYNYEENLNNTPMKQIKDRFSTKKTKNPVMYFLETDTPFETLKQKFITLSYSYNAGDKPLRSCKYVKLELGDKFSYIGDLKYRKLYNSEYNMFINKIMKIFLTIQDEKI